MVLHHPKSLTLKLSLQLCSGLQGVLRLGTECRILSSRGSKNVCAHLCVKETDEEGGERKKRVC